MGLVRLTGCVKNYAWGRAGKESRVSRLYACNSGDYVDQEKPYAEFWMGIHDSGPSYVVQGAAGVAENGERKKLTLKNWIENNPSALGENVVNKWGTNLPFLFKKLPEYNNNIPRVIAQVGSREGGMYRVFPLPCEGELPEYVPQILHSVLSVAKALSIQAHPDKDLASRLHRELPDVYKDDNHKPEMALALTEFEALCGFISLEELKLIVQTVPEIVELVGTARAEQVLELNEDGGKEKGKLVLQSVFTELMSASKDVVTEVIAKLISRLHVKNQARELTEKEQVVLRLEKQYPADVGVLAAFLLNYVKLNPGEALYLGANEPHAYIYGDCVECMATSDNVVRAGLTPKHRDVKTLCSMLTYRQGFPEILHGTAVNPHVMRYIPPFDEFEVDRCIFPEQSTSEFPAIPGPSIFMVLEGEGTVTTSSNEIIREGDVFFAPANTGITVSTSSGLHLYRTGVNCRFFKE